MNDNANDLNKRENNTKKTTPDTSLPYDDPAVVNPEELASFPKGSKITDAKEVELERKSHLVNKRSPLREGRNITRTDDSPE
jgi:hypothetical protein